MRTRIRLSLAILVAAAPLLAQSGTSPSRPRLDCDDRDWSDDQETFCEIREVTLTAPAGGRLAVDGRENGGVTIHGWDRNDVLVRARIRASADTREEAESLAHAVNVLSDGDRIRSDGPGHRRHAWWSASYEVFVPRRLSLDADTHNGGISADGISGRLDLRAVNGGISLRDVSGDVRGETTNGGVYASLMGTSWNGSGLELETTNGSVTLDIPRGYNAQLETGTVNGHLEIDFPITIQGQLNRRIRTTLGSGGPLVRATTTNGGVRIRQRS